MLISCKSLAFQSPHRNFYMLLVYFWIIQASVSCSYKLEPCCTCPCILVLWRSKKHLYWTTYDSSRGSRTVCFHLVSPGCSLAGYWRSQCGFCCWRSQSGCCWRSQSGCCRCWGLCLVFYLYIWAYIIFIFRGLLHRCCPCALFTWGYVFILFFWLNLLSFGSTAHCCRFSVSI